MAEHVAAMLVGTPTSGIENAKDVIDRAISTKQVQYAVLSLHDLSNKIFKNTRPEASADHISNIANTLGDNKHNEQLVAINAAVATIDGANFIGIYAGFTRFEAMQRLALEGVINAWNEENKISPDSANYIHPFPDCGYEAQQQREVILQAGGRWAERYNEALKVYPVKVELSPSISDLNAFKKSFIENNARQNAPAWATADNLQRLKTSFSVSWKDIASMLGLKQATVSQYNAMYAVPDAMKEMYSEDKEMLKLGDADEKVMQVCIDEYVRRASLPVNDPCAINLSHGRIFGQLLSGRKNNGVNFKDAMKLIRDLCRVSEDGKIQPKAESANYTVFSQLVDNAKNRVQSKTKEEDTDDIIAILSGGKTSSSVATSGVTIDDIAELQRKEKELSDKAESMSHGAETEIDFDDIMKQITEKGSGSESAEAEAVVETESPSEPTILDDDEDGIADTEDLLKDLIGDVAEDIGEVKPSEITGEKKVSTVSGETSLKVRSIDSIVDKITTAGILLEAVVNEADGVRANINYIEAISTISSIVSMAEVIGDTATHKKYSEMLMTVSDKTANIWEAMISHARKTMNAEQFQKIEVLFPDISL